MDKPQNGPLTLTREELYNLVWETPISRLAPRFGLSDVGLAKLCVRHGVPRPPRGHWARLQHGKPVYTVPLPPVEDEAPQTITIDPARPAATRGVQASASRNSAGAAVESKPPAGPTVARTLEDPCPLVARTARSIRSARADDTGLFSPRARRTLDVSVGPDSVERALCILDALVKAFEGDGCGITTTEDDGPRRTIAEIDGEING